MSTPVRFHLSLNVTDLARSVAFFRTLLGVEPAKVRADYAKFEPDEPPLVLSLEPAKEVGHGGALNHVGFRMPDSRALVAMQERLERAGMRTRREEGVECCYAKQTKFWAHDPDGNLWEVYTFEGDIEHRGAGQSQEAVLSIGGCAAPVAATVWEHRMNEPIPTRVPFNDGELDEVRLRGTLNLPIPDAQRSVLLAEVSRVLRPGGRVFVHVLAGERPVENPNLPGPAGAVRAVPFETDPVEQLEAAGFVGARMLKFDAKPCFVRDGVGMRELQLEAFTPNGGNAAAVEVMYKGPFRELRDDEGRVFIRGRRVSVSEAVAERLRSPELAAQFTVFPPTADRPATVTACGSSGR
jgi:catechol 2,3-dioxygenase-like lactoylglutathione lyase family enzyme